MMKPAEILREIAYPLTEMASLLAMIMFFLLGSLAGSGGLFGLFLWFVILPPMFRYLLYLLEARAARREAPALDAALFGLAENLWSLIPLILIVAVISAQVLLAKHFSPTVALLFGGGVLLIFPASSAVLAITRSPVQGLSPVAWIRLIRVCGLDYALILVVMGLFIFALPAFLRGVGLPEFALEMVGFYALFLLFTFTGAVVGRSNAIAMVSIPDAAELTPDEVEDRTDAERARTLGHAYGFISRNDRVGGFAHLQTYIDASADPVRDYHWFFNEMLGWEKKDEALFFAQRYLTFLLDVDADTDVLKLIARCRLENERFKPLPADRDRALQVARRLQHDELVKVLQ
ncbi:MAG: hypothetical protein GXP15_09580 [Gammaproteobacteria bacterium]|nr:hypothetical protein [Gammaproteobacteria bacterium]